MQEALTLSGLPARQLILEMTESALVHDLTSVTRRLQGLRVMGVRIAMDDFGTGYSSLAYLRHLPVDCLKVDRSFVAELADGHAEIASAVIALARNLNLCTVAEGVETVQQAEELATLGATYLQGFSLAEPMTGGHAAAWFAAHGEITL